MDPEDFQRIREAMPEIGTIRSFGPVESADVASSELLFYIEGDNGGVRFPIDAVRAQDMAEELERLADELTVEE